MKSYFSGLSRGTFLLACASLFADTSTEMLYPVLPIGLAGLVASVVGGQLWTRIGPSATFAFGAACALLGSIAVVVLVPQHRSE